MRRGILGIEGATVDEVRRLPCTKKPMVIQPAAHRIHSRLKGQAVQKVDRWGKRLILDFGELRLVFEPRMTGLVLLNDPPSQEHLRLQIRFRGGTDDLYFWDRRGLGNIRLYNSQQFEERFGNGQLGPDALEITESQLAERLGKRKTAVKIGLLDQKAVAGVGNIYASEILYQSKVDPRTRCNRLSARQWHRVFENLQLIMREAIKYEGSSLGDGTFRTVLNDPGSYQNHHRVYDREAEKCGRCKKAKIKRIVQAQRSTYFCPGCQRKRG